jgi:hypothetical protein
MYYSLDDIKIFEEIERRTKKRHKDFGRVHISAKGTTLAHNLGVVPKIISIHPLDLYLVEGSLPTWILSPQPDSKNIYIKSSVDGYFLVYVSGG